MTEFQKPNRKQAADGKAAAIMKNVLDAYMREYVEDMLPATVVSYDRKKNLAVLQPMIQIGTTSGKKVSRAELSNIPVFRFGGGGFFISVPLKAGDTGWIKANDRDISLYMQAEGKAQDWPNTERTHSFSDAMFYPDKVFGGTIGVDKQDALVIQSESGQVCLSLHDGKIVIEAPSVEVSAPSTTWTGSVAFQGGSLTHNGVNVGSTHTHGGVQAGPGNTGVPQ